MYLAIYAVCCMFAEICFHEIWSSEFGEHFQLFGQLLVLVHVNCLEIALESFLGSIRAQKCIF
jgi:hypothetical protein